VHWPSHEQANSSLASLGKLLAFVVHVQELGADEAVDYTEQKFDEVYRDKPFDGVIDAMGGGQGRLAFDGGMRESSCSLLVGLCDYYLEQQAAHVANLCRRNSKSAKP
jgi:hypothetical protein